MLRLYPPPNRTVPVDAVYERLGWPPPPATRPHVAINMVSTADGRAAVAGRTTGIGTRTDRLLMRQLRAHADAVLSGANTVRAEDFLPTVPEAYVARRLARGLAPQPAGVVVCGSGRVPRERRYFRRSDFARIVVTGTTGAQALDPAVAATDWIVVAGAETVDLAAALRVLRAEHGIRWLLCEGGPTLNYGLLAAGLVDELFLTLAPKLVAGSGPTIVEGPALPVDAPVRLHLLSLHTQSDELYLRYAVQRP